MKSQVPSIGSRTHSTWADFAIFQAAAGVKGHHDPERLNAALLHCSFSQRSVMKAQLKMLCVLTCYYRLLWLWMTVIGGIKKHALVFTGGFSTFTLQRFSATILEPAVLPRKRIVAKRKVSELDLGSDWILCTKTCQALVSMQQLN